MLSPESVAAKYGLEYRARGEWYGPNPFEDGAEDDGFILFEGGNAWDRKLQKSYSRFQVLTLAGEVDSTPIRTYHKITATKTPKPKREHIDYSSWKRTVYDYSVSTGPYARVVRLDPPKGLLKSDGTPHKKTFRQQKFVDGEWTHGGPDKPVMYQHNKVVWCANIIIVEGEKAADSINSRITSHNWVATTNAGGTGNTKSWKEMAPSLKDKTVVILPDNDEPGLRHAKEVYKYCKNIAKTSILRLPGLEAKGDAADWLETHSIDDLINLVEKKSEERPLA